ncbi:MAG: L-rhamnose mutarotase [Tunicatimonas sp.]
MNRHLTFLLIGPALALLGACGPTPSEDVLARGDESVQRLVFTAELKNDSAAIAQYEDYHRAENVWPEVDQAARAAGFVGIDIYRFGNRLVMIQEFAAEADKQRIDSLYAASSPRLSEWGRLMETLQQPPPGAPPGQTWVEMKEVYQFLRPQ